MIVNSTEEIKARELTVVHGLGIFVLLLIAELIVAGISMSLFGFHLMLILTEALVLLLPLSFFSAAGYSFRRTLAYPRALGLSFWMWVMVATVFLLLIISDITGHIHQLMPRPEAQQKALLKILVAESWLEYLFRLFGACALAGFCEEFAFRGFLQSVFSKRIGAAKGILLTGFVFAFMHLDPWTFPGVFLLGVFLGYLVHLTGNLWVPIFVHAFSNTLSFSIAFFSPDIGADFGYTFPPYVTLLSVFFFTVSLRGVRRFSGKDQPATVSVV